MNIRKIFCNFYWKLESVIAPSLKYSQTIYEGILHYISLDRNSWLDLGCGHHLLPPWRKAQEEKLVQHAKLMVGLDYDFGSLVKHTSIHNKVRGEILELPFADTSFDLVTSNMVFEHLKEPQKQLAEIFRILKPGGILVFHTPNAFSYATMMANLIPEFMKGKLVYFLQGREEEDVFPAFYRINIGSSIRKDTKAIGFQEKRIKHIVTSAQLVMIPPLAFLELIFIRILMTKYCKGIRTNIIAIFEKPNCLVSVSVKG